MSLRATMLKSIERKDVKHVVRKAFDIGWEPKALLPPHNAEIIWPQNGKVVVIPLNGGFRNSHEIVADQIERICGIDLYAMAKASHPEVQVKRIQVDVDVDMDQVQERIRNMLVEYENLTLEFKVITSPGETPAEEVARSREILRRILSIERALAELRYPLPDFTVYSN